MKTTLKLALVVVLSLGASTVFAFHSGGVAYCAGCHTMHNSQDNHDEGAVGSFNYLLTDANATDTCLSCHASYGQFDGGLGYGPGGDFYWMTKTFSWSAHGGTDYSYGDSHGHNVISPANGIMVDATLSSAPGGNFSSNNLTCTSCHDPHGNQNFRLLYGNQMGPIYPGGPSGRYNFVNAAPLAKGNSRNTYVGGNGNETDSRHTIYKNGMSEWCANCHSAFLSNNAGGAHVHPAGREMGSVVAATYNAYVDTDHPSDGTIATAYRGLTPFEAVNVNLATANPANYTQGADGVDKVMCLTCHRAHASAFPDAGRWDFHTAWIIDSHPKTGDAGASAEDVTNKYYQYTFTNNQRSLCNKCHTKDAFDRPHA